MDKFLRLMAVLLIIGSLCPPVLADQQIAANAARVQGQGEASPKVELFTTSWCGYCKRAKAYFNARGVSFTEYDVERDPTAARRFRTINPRGGVPVALIGNRQINGFAPAAYEAALGPAR